MKTWLVTRHPGAIEWFKQQGITFDYTVPHIGASALKTGDVVYGTLPINLISQLNLSGVRYFHIDIKLPFSRRGTELTAAEMESYDAQIVEYFVAKIPTN